MLHCPFCNSLRVSSQHPLTFRRAAAKPSSASQNPSAGVSRAPDNSQAADDDLATDASEKKRENGRNALAMADEKAQKSPVFGTSSEMRNKTDEKKSKKKKTGSLVGYIKGQTRSLPITVTTSLRPKTSQA